jgi:hypothetical protein
MKISDNVISVESVLIGIVTCRVVHVVEMTGSSSDDWILLALWLQPLLITLTYMQRYR